MKLRQIAAAGNSAALVLLVAVLAQAPVLFENSPPGLPSSLPPTRPRGEAPPPARRVLLVVIDGLRADAVAGMPRLDRLAREGGRGTSRVESLIPSTVAGIRALAEGEVPPPASFLQDFGSPPAPRGGVFAAVRSAGLPTFAAGPRLWRDLYGRWLDRSVAVATVAGDDERILQAGLAAFERDGLIVLHWNEPDDAAHLHGGNSPEYRRTLAWCDAALGRLLDAAGRETAVVVTSDHGVIDRGGHAGPETEVVVTPVIVHGPGTRAGDLGELRQRDVHRLVLGPLDLSLERTAGPRPVSRWGGAFVLAALALGLLLWGSLIAGTEHRRAAFRLNAALWVALAAAVAGFPMAAVLLALAGLGWGSLQGDRDNLIAAASLVLAGGLLGLLRIADGRGWEIGLPGAAALAGIGLAGVVLGRWLGRLLSGGTRAALLCALACAAAPVLLARLSGETASLSTLDVRAAFRLVDGPLGLAGAVTAAALRQALPSLTLLLGLAPSLRRCPPAACGAFAAGLAAALAGQAAAGSLLLGESSAYALGLLVRLIGEVSFLFLGCALGLALRRRGGPPRPPAATPP